MVNICFYHVYVQVISAYIILQCKMYINKRPVYIYISHQGQSSHYIDVVINRYRNYCSYHINACSSEQ